MQIRAYVRRSGTVDIMFKKTRPGEQRMRMTPDVAPGEVKKVIEAGVDEMRKGTKFDKAGQTLPSE